MSAEIGPLRRGWREGELRTLPVIRLRRRDHREIEGQSEPDCAETPGFTVADEKVIEQLRARLLDVRPDDRKTDPG